MIHIHTYMQALASAGNWDELQHLSKELKLLLGPTASAPLRETIHQRLLVLLAEKNKKAASAPSSRPQQ